jgi:hypothetical protein
MKKHILTALRVTGSGKPAVYRDGKVLLSRYGFC